MNVTPGTACRHTAIKGKSLELGSGTQGPRDEAKTWKAKQGQGKNPKSRSLVNHFRHWIKPHLQPALRIFSYRSQEFSPMFKPVGVVLTRQDKDSQLI